MIFNLYRHKMLDTMFLPISTIGMSTVLVAIGDVGYSAAITLTTCRANSGIRNETELKKYKVRISAYGCMYVFLKVGM